MYVRTYIYIYIYIHKYLSVPYNWTPTYVFPMISLFWALKLTTMHFDIMFCLQYMIWVSPSHKFSFWFWKTEHTDTIHNVCDWGWFTFGFPTRGSRDGPIPLSTATSYESPDNGPGLDRLIIPQKATRLDMDGYGIKWYKHGLQSVSMRI